MDLRIIEQAELELSRGLTVLVGPNGSGKTSVLEGIHLLALGRSFRSQRPEDVVRRGQASAVVSGSLADSDGALAAVGVELDRSGVRIRVNQQSLLSRAELARLLPLVLVTPDSQRLLTDGADLRRRLMDWSLFHVEHDYGLLHKRYRRGLRQRTALLRAGASAAQLAPWNQEVGAAGDTLHQARARLLEEVLPLMAARLAELLSVVVAIGYRPGWDTSRPLADVLEASTAQDLARGFGDQGPQRGDLRFTIDGRPARHVLSRGESKLFVSGMVLGQVEHLRRHLGAAPTVLIDDLASELDDDSRSRWLAALRASGAQTVVTAVSADLVESSDWPSRAMFHVEQGRLRPVL